MATFAIANRPFATEPATGLMTPDGIFEVALGQQTINAQVKNAGASAGAQIYVESVDDPGIVVTPTTHDISPSVSGASQRFGWEANFTAATPGKHMISFVVQANGTRQRLLQRIFVTKTTFDPASKSFSVATPEGVLSVRFMDMIGPKDSCCCAGQRLPDLGGANARNGLLEIVTTASDQHALALGQRSLLSYLSDGARLHDPNFVLCMPQVLLGKLEANLTPTPPYTGQYGDLPFQDPWWKIVLAIVAFLLLVAAAIAEAVGGSGDLTAGGGGTHDLPSGSGGSCCTPAAGGGGTSGVAAGLLAAAATVATIAGASDQRDPFRKGQDHTKPTSASEITTSEALRLEFNYSDDIVPGKPFKVGIDYKYVRTTDSRTYDYSASESNANVHLLDRYVLNAPNVVRPYKKERFIVDAQFYDGTNRLFRGDQLFVECYLIGPQQQLRTFGLQDSGVMPDTKANDGTYTGGVYFTERDGGLWKYFVLAQDINNADPNLTPEQAAQIIGGMLLTGQLQISFHGGTCQLVPDGDVNVLT
jgi:hypothetical protein